MTFEAYQHAKKVNQFVSILDVHAKGLVSSMQTIPSNTNNQTKQKGEPKA